MVLAYLFLLDNRMKERLYMMINSVDISFKDCSWDFIADLLVHLAFGTVPSVSEEYRAMFNDDAPLPSSMRPLADTDNEDEVMGLRLRVREETRDREYWVKCDHCEDNRQKFSKKTNCWWNLNPDNGYWEICATCNGKRGWHDCREDGQYFTCGGDEDGEEPLKQLEKLQRNFAELAPDTNFYSAAKCYNKGSNVEGKVAAFLLSLKDEQDATIRARKAQAAWKRLWALHYQSGGKAFSPRVLKRYRTILERDFGCCSQKKREAAVARVMSCKDKVM